MGVVLQFGAGNIGRGLIAPIFNKNNYEVIFLDIDPKTIELLNTEDTYNISYYRTNQSVEMTNFSAVNTNNQDKVNKLFSEADFISVSVGINAVKYIAENLALAIRNQYRREDTKEMKIIAFENSYRATSYLKEKIEKLLNEDEQYFMNRYIKFYDSAIDGVIPDADTDLSLISENYYELIIESEKDIKLEEVLTVSDLDPYIMRKLFIVNMGHAALAWRGHAKGYSNILNCVQDEEVVKLFHQATMEATKVLQDVYPKYAESIQEYRETIEDRFINHALPDDISRIGRNPITKLSREERFLKPALLYFERFNAIPHAILTSVTYGFKYLIDTEKIIINTEASLIKLVEKVTSFNKDSVINKYIVATYIEKIHEDE